MTATAIAASSRPVSPYAVFRRRNFTLMWLGQFVETAGTALTSLAASIWVFRLTGSAMSVGLMLMASAAPSVLIGLLAGVFVDRHDRKAIMVVGNVVRAGLVLLIPFLVPLNVAWLYVLLLLASVAGQFFDPAHESVLPEVAPEEELSAANALMAISSFGSTAIGFAASGLIAGAADIRWAFYANALTYLFSAACIMLIRVKPFEPTETAGVSTVVRNLGTGLRSLFDTPVLRSLFTSGIPMMVAIGLSNALLLPFAVRALEATEFEYGLQEGLTSLGFVVGSLLMAGIFDRMREGAWIAIGLSGMALAGIAYSFTRSVALAIAVVTISGFLNAPSAIGRRLVIQRNTPRDMRGRVNSAFFVARDVLFLVGMAAAGLADVLDVRLMYLLSSLLLLVSGVWVLVLPGLRQDAAEWRRALSLLRRAPAQTGLAAERVATLADMDLLAGLLPQMARLDARGRQELIGHSHVVRVPAGSAVVRHGEAGDSAYFILAGRAAAGLPSAGGIYHSLSTMGPGDFFGEIGALTGAARTADVVADEDLTLLQVPAPTLRTLMLDPALSQLVLGKMTERLGRTSLTELPRFAGYDQQVLRELRAEPSAGPVGEPVENTAQGS